VVVVLEIVVVVLLIVVVVLLNDVVVVELAVVVVVVGVVVVVVLIVEEVEVVVVDVSEIPLPLSSSSPLPSRRCNLVAIDPASSAAACCRGTTRPPVSAGPNIRPSRESRSNLLIFFGGKARILILVQVFFPG